MPQASPPETTCHVCHTRLDPLLMGGSCQVCLWGELISTEKLVQDTRNATPKLDGYKVVDEIGRGSLGVVYQAHQKDLRRDVALKMVAPSMPLDANEKARLLGEIEAVAALAHPGILPIYETGEDASGRPWFTMQLATEGSLADHLDIYKSDWRRSAMLLVTLGDAVQFAHERGILHRDLKPNNVLFDEDQKAFVADFGIAKWDEDQDSEDLLSLAYLSPEAARDGVAATTMASDVYGLGALLYGLLTGQSLYFGQKAAHVRQQILDYTPLPPRDVCPAIPLDLEFITLKALSREPAARYASAAAFTSDLTLWLEGKPILARPVSAWEKLRKVSWRHPVLVSSVAVLAVVLLVSSLYLFQVNQRLTLTLLDSQASVGYVTQELPTVLEPLGRLDLLDSTFQRVAKHYQLYPSTTSKGRAQEASFLTQWAQILRPRGQIQAALEKLFQALEIARVGTQESPPPTSAVRARLTAGRRLGEILREMHRLPEARQYLEETLTFSAAFVSTEFKQKVLKAELELELSLLSLAEKDFSQCLVHADEAHRQWRPLLKRLEQPPISAPDQITLQEAVSTASLLRKLHHEQGRLAEEGKIQTELTALLLRLCLQVPDNLHFRDFSIQNQLALAEHPASSPAATQALLQSADAEAAALILLEKDNAKWLATSVQCAKALTEQAKKAKNTEELNRCRKLMSERLDQLYPCHSTDLNHLATRMELGRECAALFLTDDWKTARHHFQEALAAHKQLASLDPSTMFLVEAVRALFKQIRENESEPAASRWLSEYLKEK